MELHCLRTGRPGEYVLLLGRDYEEAAGYYIMSNVRMINSGRL